MVSWSFQRFAAVPSKHERPLHGEARPGVVVDGHMGELPARATRVIALIAGDAVTHSLDAIHARITINDNNSDIEKELAHSSGGLRNM